MDENFIIENNILIKYTGTDKIVKIPENINCIDENCFFNNKYIEEVILPKKCNLIKRYAFQNCTNLKKINLENIETIKTGAFLNSNLQNLELKNKELIETNAFGYCNKLKNITLENIKILEPSAFENSYVEKVEIKNIKTIASILNNSSVKEIKINSIYDFNEINKMIGYGNSNLKEVIGPNIICENGVIYDKNKKILIAYLDNNKKTYLKIPDTVEKILSWSISSNQYLKTVELGKNVKEISEFAIVCDNVIFNSNLEKLNYNGISGCQKNLDLRKTKLKDYDASYIDTDANIKIKLPITIKELNMDITYTKIILNKKCKAKIIGNEEDIEYEKTLDELIEEGKSFHEASVIIKEQER